MKFFKQLLKTTLVLGLVGGVMTAQLCAQAHTYQQVLDTLLPNGQACELGNGVNDNLALVYLSRPEFTGFVAGLIPAAEASFFEKMKAWYNKRLAFNAIAQWAEMALSRAVVQHNPATVVNLSREELAMDLGNDIHAALQNNNCVKLAKQKLKGVADALQVANADLATFVKTKIKNGGGLKYWLAVMGFTELKQTASWSSTLNDTWQQVKELLTGMSAQVAAFGQRMAQGVAQVSTAALAVFDDGDDA